VVRVLRCAAKGALQSQAAPEKKTIGDCLRVGHQTRPYLELAKKNSWDPTKRRLKSYHSSSHVVALGAQT